MTLGRRYDQYTARPYSSIVKLNCGKMAFQLPVHGIIIVKWKTYEFKAVNLVSALTKHFQITQLHCWGFVIFSLPSVIKMALNINLDEGILQDILDFFNFGYTRIK